MFRLVKTISRLKKKVYSFLAPLLLCKTALALQVCGIALAISSSSVGFSSTSLSAEKGARTRSLDSIILNEFPIRKRVDNLSYAKLLAYQDDLRESDFSPVLESTLVYNLSAKDKDLLDKYLQKAHVLFETDRLTSPVSNNALEYYQYVLLLDEGNTEALKGIREIVDRYKTLADLHVKNNDAKKASDFSDKAIAIAAIYFPEDKTLDAYKKYVKEEFLFSTIKQNAHQNDIHLVVEPEVEVESMTDKISQRIYQVSVRQVKLGDMNTAVSLLRQHLSTDKEWGALKEYLFEIYLTTDSFWQARNLLEQSYGLSAVQMAERVSRLMLLTGQYQQAIDLLESHHLPITGHEQYYGLLASAHFLNGHYERAIEFYQRLIALDALNSSYWTGYLLSCKQLNQLNCTAGMSTEHNLANVTPLLRELVGQSYLFKID